MKPASGFLLAERRSTAFALSRDQLFFARAKKSRQKKALFPDEAILAQICYRDFSIRRPWRIEKRQTSCLPPDGSGWGDVVHRPVRSTADDAATDNALAYEPLAVIIQGVKMGRTLSILGVTITIAYFGLLWFIFDGRSSEILKMAPNEIGDLLAGVFGPLAIVWLILGFFQQGIELRQNTKALELQAEELKNSVEQQRELVDVSRKQFESNLEFARQEHEKQKAASQPVFVFHTDRVSLEGNDVLTGMTIENIGATVTNVEFSYGSDMRLVRLRDMTTFESGRKANFSWNYDKTASSRDLWLAIEFTDLYGTRGEHFFDFLPGGGDGIFNGVMVTNRK